MSESNEKKNKNHRLIVHEVSKFYSGKSRKFKVLDHKSFMFHTGEFYTIMGESGVGKSTLLNIIATLLPASSGKILLDDLEISNMSELEKSNFRNKYFGIVTQESNLVSYLTLEENMFLALELCGKNTESRATVEKYLKRLNLLHLKDEYPKNLSSGEIKRSAIARALVKESNFLLLDEPTANLDSKNTKVVLQLLREKANEGIGVIITTHEKEAVEYADQKIYLDFCENAR